MGEPVLETRLVDAVAAWHLRQFLTERKFLKAHDARALLEPHSAVGVALFGRLGAVFFDGVPGGALGTANHCAGQVQTRCNA